MGPDPQTGPDRRARARRRRRLPAGAGAVPVVSRRSRSGRVCRCWPSRLPRPAGASTCGRRSTTARSATAPAGCIRWRWRAVVVIAKASAWVGALALGWWVGVLVYLLPRRGRRCGSPAKTPRARWWPPSARWLWWSPRCGCSIAASRRRTRPTTPTAPPISSTRGPDTPNRRQRSTRGVTWHRYSQPMTDLSRGARAGAAAAGRDGCC